MLTAGYLINRTPSVLNGKKPFEVLFNKIPSYSHILNFRCLAYVHNIWVHKDKFRPRSHKYVFLGYPYGKKGWKLFYLDTP